jgi:putative nucleotidyltransferase with HDIG domain
MSTDRTILLISDRPNRSKELTAILSGVGACQAIALHEKSAAELPIAVVTDVDLHRQAGIERLRELLARPRAAAVPIIAVLRNGNHLEKVQAAAIGATAVFPATAAISALVKTLPPGLRAAASRAAPAGKATPMQNVENVRIQFGDFFRAAGCGAAVTRAAVENATTSVMEAVSDGGIRQWLEVVWTYDDATYQHCMLVTGLAAQFAIHLDFGRNDQNHLVRGALLHDIGKAKIPLAILNKPDALTGEEMSVMRTHARLGYEILREQGNYEPELLDVVLRHHELLDGSGYPDGLEGNQINDLVRLITICDIYAALIERRPYRHALEPAKAFKILQEMDGKIEGALVREFAKVAEQSAAPILVQ